uniref:Uncharacterized protein n=1 Tax=Pararge aegeria TaxID=116150 RepID=S4PG40_9NEOP
MRTVTTMGYRFFILSILMAFFVVIGSCSLFSPYPLYPDNDEPTINVNPVNNAESESNSSPFTSQTAHLHDGDGYTGW